MERTKQSSRIIEMIQQQLKRTPRMETTEANRRPDIRELGWVSPLKRRLQVAIPPIHEPEKYVLCPNWCGSTHHEDYVHHPCEGGASPPIGEHQ